MNKLDIRRYAHDNYDAFLSFLVNSIGIDSAEFLINSGTQEEKDEYMQQFYDSHVRDD